MNTDTHRIIVVTGATGRQGGAVTRALLQDKWQVRAITRNANSEKARALSALGAEVTQGDFDDRSSLQTAFQGAYGLFCVQNPQSSGLAAEIRHGKLVADVAKEAKLQHLVYSAAATSNLTGVGLWDSKIQIAAHMRALNLPLTVLLPTAFMELMTDKGYYPNVSTWYLMPKLMGENRALGWISTEDVGIVTAKIFAAPERYIGQTIPLASDVRTIEECRSIYREVMGKNPSRFPMPIWLFKRVAGTELLTMWQWLRTGNLEMTTAATQQIHPEAMDIKAWLTKQKSVLP